MTPRIDRIGDETRTETRYDNYNKPVQYKRQSLASFIDVGNLLNGKISVPGSVQNSDNAFQAYNKDNTTIA